MVSERNDEPIFVFAHIKLPHDPFTMDSNGETFDVDKHEALTNVPAPKDNLKGKVVDVIEKGYLLNDKVIRFAKVVVGQ